MNDEYKYRGLFLFTISLASLAAAIVQFCMANPMAAGVNIAFFAVSAGGFVIQRLQSQEAWEQEHGIFDEREQNIRGRAARLTLKIMFVLMYGVSRLLELVVHDDTVSLIVSGVLLAAVVVGAGVYYLAQVLYDRKM